MNRLLNPLFQPALPAAGLPAAGRAKLVLVAGFAGLLIILVGLGFFAADALHRARTADSNSTRAFLLRREALSDFRRSVYSAGGSLRNYLVDPDEEQYPNHAPAVRRTLAGARDALVRYGRYASTRPELSREFAAFTGKAEQALFLSGSRRRATGYDLLTADLIPARDRILNLIEEQVHSDQTDLRAVVADTSSLLERLQNRLWLAIGASLLMGLGLTAFVYRYLAGLEAVAETKYRESVAAAAQLEQLSHRLLAVQEEERKSLARELHDEVGQSVGALLVDLGQARHALEPAPAEARLRLDAAAALGERTLKTIRDISLLLRPSMLDELGLVPALHWQAREVSRRTGMLVTVRAPDDELALPEEYRTAVFRVVQEALQNAARHSGARVVEVGLVSLSGQLHIIITDNGCGFAPALTRGLGLLGMHERVVRLGGGLKISSSPGQGTTITADIPLPPEETHSA